MKKTIKPARKQIIRLSFHLNGNIVSCQVKPSALLLDVIRETFGLKGTKPGCHEGECGACTVLVNDLPVNSCLYLAVNASGKKITTIEGLMKENGELDLVQESLVQNGAVQCGFCTSGMAITIKGMEKQLAASQDMASRDEIKKWLEGNLCRCTGYVKIVDAAEKAINSHKAVKK